MASIAKCESCGETQNLKSCASCGDVKYCSRECQTNSWPAHKWTCSDRVYTGPSTSPDGKKFGLFAKQDFAVGDVIVKEKIFLRKREYGTHVMTEDVYNHLASYMVKELFRGVTG